MERQWLTLDQIKAEYASNDYNPELLLQHLLHHVEASPASVPEGWNVAPDVPTATMCLAGEKALSEHDFLRMDSAYCAMLAAAPTPPVYEDRKDAEKVSK